MVLRKLVGIFAVTLIVCGASFATAGVPDLEESTATAADAGITFSLFCLPDAGGSAFGDAYLKGGTGGAGSVAVGADATITLTLLDGGAVAVSDFSFEDMWLQWVDESNLHVCEGGTVADGNTDDAGVTTWENGMNLGGNAECLAQVMINGAALTSDLGIPLHVNSADVDIDGDVDLLDVVQFSGDFVLTPAPYRSDFVSDGLMKVTDVSKMAVGVGASCP
ncbi:MAG: hypothetical protein KOO60_07975 [Gemmatimonadales bacterium]|nr:hypothetical protein [Gemmatimonadales bacterium]